MGILLKKRRLRLKKLKWEILANPVVHVTLAWEMNHDL